jgi:glycosyltransferase involved in cell wall biosynthesis
VSSLPLVSVIVPTYNSERFIEKCLKSISEQTYENIEITVVDNNSRDNTREIAKRFTENVFIYGPERSAQRNFGVKVSRGRYVLIIDSDMVLSENVLFSCVKRIYSNEKIKAIIIPEESFGIGFWAKCKSLEKSYYVGLDWMEAARFFEKDTYILAGGYDENMVSGEDWDLSQRVERIGEVARISEYIFHDEGEISLIETMKKKFYYAKNFNLYISKLNNKDKISKQVSIKSRYKIFLSNPKKLFKNPILGLGLLLMKTIEFGCGGLAYFISKFIKK